MHLTVWLLVGVEWATVVACVVLAEMSVRRAVRSHRPRPQDRR
jgi:hypothetical protein